MITERVRLTVSDNTQMAAYAEPGHALLRIYEWREVTRPGSLGWKVALTDAAARARTPAPTFVPDEGQTTGTH